MPLTCSVRREGGFPSSLVVPTNIRVTVPKGLHASYSYPLSKTVMRRMHSLLLIFAFHASQSKFEAQGDESSLPIIHLPKALAMIMQQSQYVEQVPSIACSASDDDSINPSVSADSETQRCVLSFPLPPTRGHSRAADCTFVRTAHPAGISTPHALTIRAAPPAAVRAAAAAPVGAEPAPVRGADVSPLALHVVPPAVFVVAGVRGCCRHERMLLVA